ncbi:hypothetical protein Nepgr_014287 [Nepenthes gracilis]|uniref:peptidylprolyl isomerase n=1 Tax=Nepenthes gracilis TaxID=150966 RepID=A0AAD3SLG2_NEPGR|nr:hypothetical protein Nepgr_014287 [Nepenthes gracilis]
MTKKKNLFVFMDVSVDGNLIERMVFELFYDVAPRTAENFRALCTGEKGTGPKLGKPLHYKGTFFHQIIKGSLAQGGDFLRQQGSAGESIYGEKFPDELPKLKHDERGLLSMSVSDRDTCGSIFSLTFKADHSLDRKNVVFGKLVQGYEVLKKIEDAGDEEGRPIVTVKIINCGECTESDRKKLSKLKLAKDAPAEAMSNDTREKRRYKKSSRDKRKRRKYYESDSDSSSDSELDTSESDTDSELDSSSMSDMSSSSDDRRRKRKRSKRDKYRRGKRRDRRHEKKRRRRDKRSKQRSKRSSNSPTEAESGESENSSEDNEVDAKGPDQKQKDDLQMITAGNHSPIIENEIADNHQKAREDADLLGIKVGKSPKENGEQSNKYERDIRSDRCGGGKPEVLMSRSRSISPKRVMSKSMSISPERSMSRSRSMSPKRSLDRCASVGRSPVRDAHRSISKSLGRSGSIRSSARSISRSRSRSMSRSGKNSSPSPRRTSALRSVEKSPAIATGRSRSPVRSAHRSISPVRSPRRSISRSSGLVPSRRVASRSPIQSPRWGNQRRYSRSRSPPRKARSPPSDRRSRSPVRRPRSPPSHRGRSLSRSPSPDGSPKRIRRGRGFSDRYSYARRYRTPSPDRYHYDGRSGRNRYSSHRRYSDRSPRHYRSPRRSPVRYRARKSRTRSPSLSRSPPHRRRGYSRSPIRSRSPVEPSRYRPSPHAEKHPASSSRSRTPNHSPSASRSSRDSIPATKPANKGMSRSPTASPPGKKGLVSYGDGSPDSGQR